MNNTETKKTIVVPAAGDPYTGSAELLREYSLTIKVNGEMWKRLVCTAMMLRELVTGHLLAEERIGSEQDILDLEIDEEKGMACVQISDMKAPETAGGAPELDCVTPEPDCVTPEPDCVTQEPDCVTPEPERVFSLIERFAMDDTLHRRTSGTHSVLLDYGGQTAFIAEDINRHNALDKAIGAMLLKGLEPEDCMFFTSGRVAFDTMRKIVAARVPVLVSKAVPTADAVRLAQKNGVVLIGRAWPDHYEIYAGEGSSCNN